MIFLIDLSPLYNYWLLSGSWGKLLVGALKGSLGGVMPLRPSIPDPFQAEIYSFYIKVQLQVMVTPGPTIPVSDYRSPHPKIKPTIMSITQIENLEKINIALQFSFHYFWENVFEVKLC